MPYQSTYTSPVAQLLTLGEEPVRAFLWLNYLEQGISESDIPELIRMATDEDLLWAPTESRRVWAPVHAWRALGELHAESAIEPLLGLFDELEDDDWLGEVMPAVFGLIGPAALPALAAFMADPNHDEHTRIIACESIRHIALCYPASAYRCVELLHKQLMRFEDQPESLNGFLILRLAELEYTQADSLIQLAFKRNKVDESVAGDYPMLREIMYPDSELKRIEKAERVAHDLRPIRDYLPQKP